MPVIVGPRRTHNYYSPATGEFTARVMESWKKLHNFKPMTMSATGTGLSATSLASKIRYGMLWLAENCENPDVRAYFQRLRSEVRVHIHHNNIDLSRTVDPATTMSLIQNRDVIDMRADLLAWVDSIKPLRQKFERLGLDLGDDDLAWFSAKLAELEQNGYCGVIKRNHIIIVNYPKNLLLSEE